MTNNASNGAHIYESWDGGQSYHSCLDRRGAVMISVDRRGWFYTGSEAGAFVNMHGGRNACTNGSWQVYYDVRREWRRSTTKINNTKSAHDYQRINIDFAGKVAFGSDQGMFIQPNGTGLEMYSANGDVNNNVIMHPAIAQGMDEGETCIVTALWDWSPVSSWIAPRGGDVLPHAFEREAGSRSKPSGVVYAPAFMGAPPWVTLADKEVSCTSAQVVADLGVTNG